MADASNITNPSRRSTFGLLVTAPAAMMVVAAGAAIPLLSEELRVAIEAHKTIQATIGGMTSENETAWDAALDAEDEARWALAEMPCHSDADFFAKVAYLLAHEKKMRGAWFTHKTEFGDLAFAIELHLEQKTVAG